MISIIAYLFVVRYRNWGIIAAPMLCPYCGYSESVVLESRDAVEGKAIRRRRECEKCKKRFTTYEEVKTIELRVLKSDGKVEDYSRNKLLKCMERACWRFSSDEQEKFVDEIEMKLLNWGSVEIPSREIGMLVMELLKRVDPMAYIRFATVFLHLEKIEDFEKLIKEYKKK